jgi:hypothetical protein
VGIGSLIKSGLKFKQYMRLLLVLLFLSSSCATLPVEKECATPGEIQLTVNVGFEVEHKSCIHDLEAISWLITISIWDDECKELSTNLVSWWSGCMYKLWQKDSPDDWAYVGRFKNLDTLGEFIKVTRPFAASQSISYREGKRTHQKRLETDPVYRAEYEKAF